MAAEDTVVKILVSCDGVEAKWKAFMAEVPGKLDRALDSIRVPVVPDNLGPIPIPGEPKYAGLPGFVKDELREKVLSAIAKVDALIMATIEIWRYVASLAGSPTQMRAAAAVLTSSVTSQARSFDVEMMGDSLRAANSGDAWTSPAAETYSRSFQKFSHHSPTIGVVAGDLAGALTEGAQAIDDFYEALDDVVFGVVMAIGGLIFAIIGAIVSLGVLSVVGLVMSAIGIIQAAKAWHDMMSTTESTQGAIVDRVNGGPDLTWKPTAFAS